MTLWQDAFKILIWLQILKIQIILLRGNFNTFRPKNSGKCHKTHNRPLPWQRMSKRLNLFILFMYTQRPFTSQYISKIYFLTFASYIEKLPETTIKSITPKRPHPRSNVIQRSSCFRNALWLPNLVGITPDQIAMHCWGQRSCRGQLGSTRGQIA